MNKHRRFIAQRGRMHATDPAASLRADALFNDENDHNPWVFTECDVCKGRGHYSRYPEAGTHQLVQCGKCEGTRIDLSVERYFQNDDPEQEVHEYAPGWVRCPTCGSTFALRDPQAWTGRRHKARGGFRGECGQKLRIMPGRGSP